MVLKQASGASADETPWPVAGMDRRRSSSVAVVLLLILSGLLVSFDLVFQPGIVFAQADTNTSKVLGAPRDDIKVEDLKDLNSAGDDATSFISPSDGSFYFTKKSDGKNFLCVAKRIPSTDRADKSSHWEKPQSFAEFPGRQNVGSLSVAGDGVTAVIGVCNRPDGILGSCDIYQAEMIEGKLDHIVPLGKPINSEWWEGQPCISQDGQLLFFASDRKGGHGGVDIYMSSKTAEGKWSEPINLSFNTSGNELSPFIARDNQTLYFAADHLPGGLGGYDIYMTRRTGENEWTEPKNLGPSVNSRKNELFFFVPPAEDAVYFSSDREGGQGGYDLYRVYVQAAPPKPKYVTLTGRLLDAETGQPISRNPEIEMTMSNTGQSLSNEASGPTYSIKVLAGSLVHVKAGAEAYVSNAIEVQAPPSDEQPVVTQDISLTPAHARVIGHVTNAFPPHNPMKATVILEQLAGGAPPQQVESDPKTGAYAFNVNPLITYRLSTTVPDFEPWTDNVDIPSSREKLIEVTKEIRLTPANIEHVMIFFETDKSDVSTDQLGKFSHFIQQVKENPVVRIEVNGYTDTVGSIEYNMKLSERRAGSVVDYLLSQGVPRDQVAIVKGFGKANLLDPTDQAKNRRVEVRIEGKKD